MPALHLERPDVVVPSGPLASQSDKLSYLHDDDLLTAAAAAMAAVSSAPSTEEPSAFARRAIAAALANTAAAAAAEPAPASASAASIMANDDLPLGVQLEPARLRKTPRRRLPYRITVDNLVKFPKGVLQRYLSVRERGKPP